MGRNRKQPLADVTPQDLTGRERVLKSAARLLLDVGYQRMTLGRISEASGVGGVEILLKEDPKEMQALYQYIVPLAIALEAMDRNAMLCSIYKTMCTTPRLFEMLVDRHASYAHLTFAREFTAQECYERILVIRASLSGFVLAHEFKYLFPREQLKRLILTQALEIFGVPEKKIELLLVELETQKEKMLEIGRQLFEELRDR